MMLSIHAQSGTKALLRLPRLPNSFHFRTYKPASPRVRASRASQNTKKPLSAENTRVLEVPKRRKWPLETINAACVAGTLPASPADAIAVLDRFQDLAGRKTWDRAAAEELLREHRMEPNTLTLLAQILLRTTSDNTQLALTLTATAAQLGDARAAMFLVDQSLKSENPAALQTPAIQIAFKQLLKLVESGEPAATVLWGKALERRDDAEAALKAFRAAIEASLRQAAQAEDELAATARSILGEAWEGVARLEARLGQAEAAIEAWKTAALKYDSPKAFYELALQEEKGSSARYQEYLEKAAMSGISDAAFKLGMMHASNSKSALSHAVGTLRDESPRESSSKEDKMAQEWFAIAAAYADNPSTGADTAG